MSRKILFIGFDDFSNINQPVIDQLTKHFQDYAIQKTWLKPKLKKEKLTLTLAFGYMLWELGADFFRGDKKWSNWRNHFYSTGFMVKTLSRLARKEAEKENYAFTFQTQSLFKCPGGVYGNFIYTDHTNLNNLTYDLVRKKEYLASLGFRNQEREIYHDAESVFVMSRNIKRSLLEHYGLQPQKANLVYAGGDSGNQYPYNRQKFESKTIVFAGKDWFRKGGPLLVEAFKRVLKKIPDAQLIIFSCTPKMDIPNVDFRGVVPKKEVLEAFSKAAVFCLPTKREPFGMVFIEAMFNRLPIVCTSIGATPDLVENGYNGYRVPYQAGTLAEKLCYFLENPAIAERFAEHGFKKAEENYTWDQVGHKMATVIKERIAEKSNKEIKIA